MKCSCGAMIVVSERDIAECDVVECPECGTDNYIDEEMKANIDEGLNELDFT